MKSYLPLKVVLHRIGEPLLEDYGARQKPLHTPQDIFEFWQNVIASKPDFEPDKEHLFTILLDAKLRPKCYHLTALGSLNECTAHPREIFRVAIVSSAFGLVVAHNHPSGDADPSHADRQLTAKLRDAANQFYRPRNHRQPLSQPAAVFFLPRRGPAVTLPAIATVADFTIEGLDDHSRHTL